jgi:spermidine/putrescine transport system permease protein
MKNQKRWGLFFFLSPVLLWLVVLIVLPQIDLLLMSFRLENDQGKMVWSLTNYLNFFNEPIYWLTFVRTAIYSILVTFLTFIIALPVAFYITKVVAPKFQGFLLVLLLLPFWVSELVRVYGWMILLRESGVINHFLTRAGILGQPVEMLYRDSTMILGLVYTSSPSKCFIEIPR